ncbi:hypothetical protein [Ruegeria atlantica]|uniref:hypothetical protein n=1 Tax=Ruegeria atlantica TaxID=81569 RepID=UPI0014800EB3|nr:hypothetical protein [Ruegeria atlantica]
MTYMIDLAMRIRADDRLWRDLGHMLDCFPEDQEHAAKRLSGRNSPPTAVA